MPQLARSVLSLPTLRDQQDTQCNAETAQSPDIRQNRNHVVRQKVGKRLNQKALIRVKFLLKRNLVGGG